MVTGSSSSRVIAIRASGFASHTAITQVSPCKDQGASNFFQSVLTDEKTLLLKPLILPRCTGFQAPRQKAKFRPSGTQSHTDVKTMREGKPYDPNARDLLQQAPEEQKYYCPDSRLSEV